MGESAIGSVSGPADPAQRHLKDIVDAVVRIETYYHLLLMQKPLFMAAVDQAYKFEQVHLKQREIITGHIGHADSLTLALAQWAHTRLVENHSIGRRVAFRAVFLCSLRQDRAPNTGVARRTRTPPVPSGVGLRLERNYRSGGRLSTASEANRHPPQRF